MGSTGSSRKPKQKRIKIMAILWMMGLLCWAGMSFFLPLVLMEFIYPDNEHQNHRPGDTTTTNTDGTGDIARTSKVKSQTTNVVGVHQLVQATLQLHNQQQQQQPQQHPAEQQPPARDEKKQQPQPVPTSMDMDMGLARGVAGRPMSETPALLGARRAQVQCDVSVADARLAYWDDPVGLRDAHFTSVFHSQQERDQQEQETQYITFSPDPGGWNNVSTEYDITFIGSRPVFVSFSWLLGCIHPRCCTNFLHTI
jgi:hypothetical protein